MLHRSPLLLRHPRYPQEQTTFFHRVFAKEGDIFEGSICEWEAMKELILRGIFEGLQELKSFSILDVPDAVTSRVAWVVPTAEKSGIWVGWLDRIIGEISTRRDHTALARKKEHLSTGVAELREELGAEQQLGKFVPKFT